MVVKSFIRRVLITCATCLALPPVVAWSQGLADADSAEITRYRLTKPALAKYAAATRALAPVLAENPQECGDNGDESLSGLAARLDAIPGAPAALRTAGMSSHEYVVFMLAAFQAGMGAWALTDGQGELPAGFSAANVAFYQDHEAGLQQLAGMMPEADCGDDEDYIEEDYGGSEEGAWEGQSDEESGDEAEYDG